MLNRAQNLVFIYANIFSFKNLLQEILHMKNHLELLIIQETVVIEQIFYVDNNSNLFFRLEFSYSSSEISEIC